MVDQLQLMQGIIEAHRWHVEILAPHAGAGQLRLQPIGEAGARWWQAGGPQLLIAGRAMHGPLLGIQQPLLIAIQLAS